MMAKNKKFLLLIFIYYLHLSTAITSEFEQLLSVKSSFSDPFEYLSSWNSSLPICQWHGVSCYNSSHHVGKIELSGKNLSGRIPDAIFRFAFLETIDLSNNQLFGEIPRNLSSCLQLKVLNLSNNNLTGSIPGGFNNQVLETFDLSNNMISGKIPENIGLLSGLRTLDFGGNLLEGAIPKSITNLSKLEIITLASNQLSGEIPRTLGLMKNLRWIYLGYNNLSGGIPEEFGELTFLYHLDLVYNNLTGEIPSSFGNLTNLQYLFLYFNKLNGVIPPTIFSLKSMVSLDLSGNLLSGEIPEEISQMTNLEVLHLFSNNFTGEIPKSLSFLPRLKVLQLWSNKFSGEIPAYLGKYCNLTVLDLSTNNLTGKIPETLCSTGQLSKLILFSNYIQGGIPKNLGKCKSLERVRVQNNLLSGELPAEFTQLPLVYYLDVSGNTLFGNINALKWRMPELQMLNMARNRFSGESLDLIGSNKLENLDLSENGFSGSIPKSIGKLTELVELKLAINKLSGKIPDEISVCKKLVSLDLSQNHLTGEIPASLSDMPVLGILDLSANELTGVIPRKLGNVGSLVEVNVSHNHFRGSLPSTGAFLAINSSAVAGNDLCGGEEISGLPACKRGKSKSPSFWWFLLSCLLAIFVTFALIAYVIIFVTRPKKDLILKEMDGQDNKWELVFFSSKASKSISIQDIISSTREENRVNNGKNGALYKGNSNKSHIQFVAETFSDTCDTNWRHLLELGCKIHHPNIVKVLAACRSGKGLGILVFEYINDGKDLSEALITGFLSSWERRQKVAIGIARTLRYLHSDCSSYIQVGNLSSRRIIVDESGEARLLLGFPELVCTTSESKMMRDETNVYGFGLLLIELLTGRNHTETKFGVHEGIVEWARYCYSDCHLDTWVDPTIKIYAIKNDPNQVVKTMCLALQCTADNPVARPSAHEVAKALELIVKSSTVLTLGFECLCS